MRRAKLHVLLYRFSITCWITVSSCLILNSQCDSTLQSWEALVQFYDKAGGIDWKNNDGWAEGKAGISCNPCDYNGQPWYGLTCVDSVVVSISLNDNQLAGTLTPGLSVLNDLTILDLSDNQLTGDLSDDIFSNKLYVKIDLSDNNFSGVIPTEIGNIPSLEILRLLNNNFSGCYSNTLFKLCNLGTSESPEDPGLNFTGNPLLPFQGNFERLCGGAPQRGAPCNDGDENTIDDTFYEDCTCRGEAPFDCLELKADYHESCNDGEALTINDTVGEDCTCAGDLISIYVPNVISKSGNNGNNLLIISASTSLVNFKFELYNRWGGLVYQSDDSEDAPLVDQAIPDVISGVYVYRYVIDESIIRYGTITIID